MVEDQRPATLGDIKGVYGDIDKLRDTIQEAGKQLVIQSGDIKRTNDTVSKMLKVIQTYGHASPCQTSRTLARDVAELTKDFEEHLGDADSFIALANDFKTHLDEAKQTVVEEREEEKFQKRAWQDRAWKPVETVLNYAIIAALVAAVSWAMGKGGKDEQRGDKGRVSAPSGHDEGL